MSYVAGLKQGGHHYLAAGLGSYGYEPDVDYTFGIPRSIHGGGATMNIPIINIYGYDGGGSEADRQNKVNYVLQVGTLSSTLEHAVPEQMFVTEENPGEAISAVKALSKASTAGQRIYHVTQANQVSTLPNIHHDSLVMNEIRNALAMGKEVITHTDTVSVPGWSGAGYIIYDPVTGDGAYKIGGGANGSHKDFEDHSTKIFLGIAAGVGGVAFAFLSGAFVLGIFLAILFAIDYAATLATIYKAQGIEDNDAIRDNATAMFMVGLAGFLPIFSAEVLAEGPILAALMAAWATLIGSAGAF